MKQFLNQIRSICAHSRNHDTFERIAGANFKFTCKVVILKKIFKADIISAVEFNHDGELLATGDKGGRVVIFQRAEHVSAPPENFIFFQPILHC